MNTLRRSRALSRIELAPVLLAAGILAFGVFYTLAYVLALPYPGLDYDVTWNVFAFDDPCDRNPQWCDMRDASLQMGDHLLQIGDLTFEQYLAYPTRVPFAGYAPGEIVHIKFTREGLVHEIDWTMLGPTGSTYFVRLIGFVIFLPFWLAGTVVVLFLRPRDTLWRLLVAFNYVTACWIAAGIPSISRIAASSLVLWALNWLLLAVYLNLHLLVPAPAFPRAQRWIVPPLYILTGIAAVLSVLRVLPASASNMAMLLAILLSVFLLIWRLFTPLASRAMLALRLMLVGNALAFGPGMVLWGIPALTNSNTASRVPMIIMTVAISLQPLFYVYALYKHRLGNLEFRANRLLSLFAFLVLYITVFMAVFVVGSQWVSLTSQALAFSLIVSIVFVTAALFVRAPFQRFIDRVAYGTAHDANDIVRTFANEIPRSLDRKALVELLTGEVMPSLLIRESALYQVSGQIVSPLYVHGVPAGQTNPVAYDVHRLLAEAGSYRPAETEDHDRLSWVRLAIAIEVAGKPTGVWLFGRRDPDDFYPRTDVELLTTLGNQVGVALENARLFENLQHRAAELERAYLELQDLDRLKDEFVQNISHELRTPLTIIQTSGELLLEEIVGNLNEDQREIIDRLTQRTRAMIRMVNDILTLQLTSLETLRDEPVDLVSLAQSSIAGAELATRQPGYENRHYHFLLGTGDNLPSIRGDRNRLNQVFDNLLDNAVKFSPQGGTISVEIHAVSLQPHDVPAGQIEPGVEVTVSDQGIGIPAAQLEHIWKRFYQVDGSSTRRFGGVGLGLAIVRNIVQAHGGSIDAESHEDMGSTFRFVLPVCRPASEESSPVLPSSPEHPVPLNV